MNYLFQALTLDSTTLVFILLIGVAAFLFYRVFIAPGEAGDEPLARHTEDQPKKPVTSKRAAAKSGATKKPAQAGLAADTESAEGKDRGTARPRQNDDLTRIEGIGPKIAQLLTKAGITTYAQLAASDMATLEATVTAGGIRFRRSVAETWPEQARLVDDEQWDPLNAIQATLKGGTKRKG